MSELTPLKFGAINVVDNQRIVRMSCFHDIDRRGFCDSSNTCNHEKTGGLEIKVPDHNHPRYSVYVCSGYRYMEKWEWKEWKRKNLKPKKKGKKS